MSKPTTRTYLLQVSGESWTLYWQHRWVDKKGREHSLQPLLGSHSVEPVLEFISISAYRDATVLGLKDMEDSRHNRYLQMVVAARKWLPIPRVLEEMACGG